MLRLWLIKQPESNVGYDDYDSAVVVATDATAATRIHPGGSQKWVEGRGWVHARGHDGTGDGWCHPSSVTAEVVGKAAANLADGQVVCASFNAG